MDRIRRNVLLLFVVGLTLISVVAGFQFYRSLFGFTIAILCCTVFEILRLGCLWSMVFQGWSLKFVAIPIYILVSMMCIFAAVTNFHAAIIERHATLMRPVEKETTRRIELIKRTFAKKVENELNELDQKIDVCKRKLAWNENSNYWKNRLDQLIVERKNEIAERDSFLMINPKEERQAWTAYHTALLGLELEPLPTTLQNSKAVTMAIQELWGVTELRAKKMVSIIIIVTTECGIILLSLLAGGKLQRVEGKAQEKNLETTTNNSLLTTLQEQFDESEIKSFFQKSEAAITNHNRLPYTRELGKKQREIRKFITEKCIPMSQICVLLNEFQNERDHK